jgi:hypothetical protein
MVQLIFDRRAKWERAPKRPSTTPATFPSASGGVTCLRRGRSAFQPTDVFSKSNVSARTALSEKKRC